MRNVFIEVSLLLILYSAFNISMLLVSCQPTLSVGGSQPPISTQLPADWSTLTANTFSSLSDAQWLHANAANIAQINAIELSKWPNKASLLLHLQSCALMSTAPSSSTVNRNCCAGLTPAIIRVLQPNGGTPDAAEIIKGWRHFSIPCWQNVDLQAFTSLSLVQLELLLPAVLSSTKVNYWGNLDPIYFCAKMSADDITWFTPSSTSASATLKQTFCSQVSASCVSKLPLPSAVLLTQRCSSESSSFGSTGATPFSSPTFHVLQARICAHCQYFHSQSICETVKASIGTSNSLFDASHCTGSATYAGGSGTFVPSLTPFANPTTSVPVFQSISSPAVPTNFNPPPSTASLAPTSGPQTPPQPKPTVILFHVPTAAALIVNKNVPKAPFPTQNTAGATTPTTANGSLGGAFAAVIFIVLLIVVMYVIVSKKREDNVRAFNVSVGRNIPKDGNNNKFNGIGNVDTSYPNPFATTTSTSSTFRSKSNSPGGMDKKRKKGSSIEEMGEMTSMVERRGYNDQEVSYST